MSQKLIAVFKIPKHALSRWQMAQFFTSGMKKPICLPFPPFNFWRQLILDINISFQKWFFKLPSWWSCHDLIDLIYRFTFTFNKTKCFCTYFVEILQVLLYLRMTYKHILDVGTNNTKLVTNIPNIGYFDWLGQALALRVMRSLWCSGAWNFQKYCDSGR